MNRWLKNGLQIFLLNVVTVGFSIAAVFALFLSGDPFLVAILALWVLPGLLLQPWALIFWFNHSSSPVILIGMTGTSILFYGLIVRWHRVEKWKALVMGKYRSSLLKGISLLAALSLLIGLFRWFDYPALNRSIPTIPGVDFSALSLDAATSKVARLGGFLDTELVWQIKVTETEGREIAAALRLEPMDASVIADEFFKQRPYWWSPEPERGTLVHATSNFPMKGRGQDGHHIFTTWDPSTGKLHAWMKLNF